MSEGQPMDIDYVSNLARIELTSAEKEKFQGQLGDVLKYFEKLQEVDVEGVEPTAHAFPGSTLGRGRPRKACHRKGPHECAEIKKRASRRPKVVE